MAIDDCAKAGEVRATAMTVASASRFMAFSTATGASFYRKYYADGIPRAAPGMRGTIRSGSLAAYCVHSPRGAKRLDRLNLHSRTGEITAARHPEAARESNQGLATARALGLNAPLFYDLRPSCTQAGSLVRTSSEPTRGLVRAAACHRHRLFRSGRTKCRDPTRARRSGRNARAQAWGQPGSWPRSMLVEMDDKFTTAVREAFAAGNERAMAAAATVVTARGAAGSRRGLGTVTEKLRRVGSLRRHCHLH